MSPGSARWIAGAVAALALAAALVVWLLWPGGPEPVVAGAVDAPAAYGEEFRVVSDDGEVHAGTILGVTSTPQLSEADWTAANPNEPWAEVDCYWVVGVVHQWEEVPDSDGLAGFGVELLSSGGVIERDSGLLECGMDPMRDDLDQLASYGDGDVFLSGKAGRTDLFVAGFSVPASTAVTGVAVSGEAILGYVPLDRDASVFEFQVTRTLDEDGVVQ